MIFNRFTTYAVIVSFLLGGLACTISGSLMGGFLHQGMLTSGQAIFTTNDAMTCCGGMRSNIAGFVHHLGQETDAVVASGVHTGSELLMSLERVSELSVIVALMSATLAAFFYAVVIRRRYGGDKVFVYINSLFSQGILNPKSF